jgi:DNA-binding MarR family transcriptional regulator
VATFLLEMNGRLTVAGVIALPMTRRDIADYLGLTLETVSRALAAFQQKGYLKTSGLHRREMIVLDPAGLAKLTDDGAIEIAMSVRVVAMPNVIASSPTSNAPASRRRTRQTI